MALALYRTYRPGTLAEVIGQEHVTAPLARALASGRTHHAYLFSGPRGCGKTSTARILARSLNCEQGPTPEPCGVCRSCVDLAPNGPGSIDVVELDAATHRGIDDARDLREKAIYAPAASRFRVYIIDEAHQLTNEAANALLKLIEEPPAHLRFIFATTEPDRIIPTIRSRTFHYPFRLVPARTLSEHLAAVCRAEEVPAQPAALAVVARAGAGSVRDSLSVLGQLLAGAGPEGLTHAEAVAALGLTDASLIDAFVEALGEGSAAAMFSVVDQVIGAGHDPRRFVADVLDRLRDLIVLRADPGSLDSGLVEVPDDAGARLLGQAQSLGLAELTRAADLISAGLSEVKGATAPRLQLELLCARIAVQQVGQDLTTLLARLDRVERMAGAASLGPAAAHPGTSAGEHRPAAQPDRGAPESSREGASSVARASRSGDPGLEPTAAGTRPLGSPDDRGSDTGRAVAAAPGPAATPPRRPTLRSSAPGRVAGSPGHASASPAGPSASPASPSASHSGPAAPPGTPVSPGQPSQSAEPGADRPAESTLPGSSGPAPSPRAPSASGVPAGGLGRVTGAWPTILATLAGQSRVAWTAFASATPLSLSEGVLAIAVAEPGAALAITQRGHDLRLRQVLIDELGLDVTVDVVHDQGAVARAGGPSGRAPGPTPGSRGQATAAAPAAPDGVPGTDARATGRLAALRAQGVGEDPEVADEPSEDDPQLDVLDGLDLITRQLGAKPIGEIDHT